MARYFVALISAFLLAACASSFAKQYVGKEITEVMLENGRPANVFDMKNGARVFQWYWGGGVIVTPGSSTSTGQVRVIGNTAHLSQTTFSNPSQVYSSKGCLISFITKRSSVKSEWIVRDYRIPKRLVC